MNKLTLALLLSFLFLQPSQELLGQRRKNNTVNYKDSLFNGIEYRSIGPFRGGRAGTVSGVANNPNLYYMGTAGGGVWKTTDAGNTWENISDGYYGGSIGALASIGIRP